MALSPPAAASTGGPRQVCNPVEALAGRDVASAKPRNPACSSRQTRLGRALGWPSSARISRSRVEVRRVMTSQGPLAWVSWRPAAAGSGAL